MITLTIILLFVSLFLSNMYNITTNYSILQELWEFPSYNKNNSDTINGCMCTIPSRSKYLHLVIFLRPKHLGYLQYKIRLQKNCGSSLQPL